MKASYEIVSDVPGQPLVIRDVGPWDRYQSVTNAAEAVVEELVTAGLLPRDRKLFYYDSDGELSGLGVRDGMFSGYYCLSNIERQLVGG